MARVISTSSAREWLDRRFMWIGGLTGLLGGLCCIGGAVALATGLGAISFLSTWEGRYTPYFIGGSVTLMALWLARRITMFGFTRSGLRRAAASIGRQTMVMGVIYGATLGLAFGTLALAEAVI